MARGTPVEQAAQAVAIDAALREHGFFAVLHHDIEPPVVAATFDAGQRFFVLAEADKQRWHIDGWPLKRGFDPVGWPALDPTLPPDLKESFHQPLDLDAEAVILPLPGCVPAGEVPRYGPVTAGERLVEMVRRTTVGTAA